MCFEYLCGIENKFVKYLPGVKYLSMYRNDGCIRGVKIFLDGIEYICGVELKVGLYGIEKSCGLNHGFVEYLFSVEHVLCIEYLSRVEY